MNIQVNEKYERNHWPSIQRPDLKPPEGWSLSLITAVNRIYNHRLSPDGDKIAFIWNREELADVYCISSRGGWPARISTNRKSSPYWWDEVPQWSPDSRWLAFCIDDHIHIAPGEGGEPQKITDFVPEASNPIWMPDSNHLIFTIERNKANKLFMTDREGKSLRILTHGPGDDNDARPSPNGKWVSFTHYPHDDLNRLDIRLIELETGDIRSLTGAPAQKDWGARWSPDSQYIAFISQRSGFNEVWRIQPDGNGLQQLTRLGKDVSDIAWSPDGNQIACIIHHEGAFNLGLIDISTGEVTYLRQGNGIYSHPNWSPQGNFLTVEFENPFLPPDIYKIKIPGGQATQLTQSNLPALAKNEMVMPEHLYYTSYDGLQIPALIYRPKKPNRAAIVTPHGGPRDQDGFGWDALTQYLVAKGYTILSPNYRGSTGYGVAYEHANQDNWGIGDTQDCLYGAKYLDTLGWVDPDRRAIYGASYGGYMVACCLSRDPEYLFSCGVCLFGDANLVSSWAQCEISTRLYTEMQLGHPSRQRQIYLEGSPIHQVNDIRKPVLILHGLDDDVVPPQSSEEWVEALRRADKTFEYKTYAGEPHGFQKRANILDLYQRIERFVDWYLMP